MPASKYSVFAVFILKSGKAPIDVTNFAHVFSKAMRCSFWQRPDQKPVEDLITWNFFTIGIELCLYFCHI